MPALADLDTWMDELAIEWVDRFGCPMPNLDDLIIWNIYYLSDHSPGEGLTRWLKAEERRDRNQVIIDAARKRIARAKYLADKSPKPDNLRPATAEDIVIDAIIWFEGYNGWMWRVVEGLGYHGDRFKAYDSDGCRYGLDGAFMEVKP